MKQLPPFSFDKGCTYELTTLDDQKFIAEWFPPITKNRKGKVRLLWTDGSVELFIMVYKAHPNDLLCDEHLNFVKKLPRKKRPNKLGNWFNGYCYLEEDGTIVYQDYQ